MKFIAPFLCLFLFINYVKLGAHELRAPEETAPENFPFQAVVSSKNTCGGVLITKNYVITPAHCLDHSSETASVNLGFRRYPKYVDNRKEENTQVLKSSDIIIHKYYAERTKGHYLNDIGLIKLSKPVVLNKKVSPGKLLSKRETHLLEGNLANVTGWITDHDLNLQMETVELLSHDTCVYLFGTNVLREQEICFRTASSTNLNLVGNILTINGKIIGFLQRRYTCDHGSMCKNVHLFQSLTPYLDWISQEVNVSIEELTGEDEVNKSDLTLIKVEAMVGMIRETKTKFEQDLAKVNEKIEAVNSELARVKNLFSNNQKIYYPMRF